MFFGEKGITGSRCATHLINASLIPRRCAPGIREACTFQSQMTFRLFTDFLNKVLLIPARLACGTVRLTNISALCLKYWSLTRHKASIVQKDGLHRIPRAGLFL